MIGKRPGVEVLELVGPDVRRFANGMFTNNVRDLEVGAHQHSALTDDRGRLLGLMDVLMLAEDRVFCVLEGITADAFEERYGMFIVFDDVELVRKGGAVFAIHQQTLPTDGLLTWPSPRSLGGGVEVWVEDGLNPFPGEPIATEEALDALRVEACWPRFPVDASDKQLPHELNLRDTHLHFEKGCYRGQEIIHRVEVMGQVRKGLVGLALNGRAEEGGTLVDEAGKKVGRLGSVVQHPSLGWLGLAVVRTSHTAPGTRLQVGEGTATVRSPVV